MSIAIAAGVLVASFPCERTQHSRGNHPWFCRHCAGHRCVDWPLRGLDVQESPERKATQRAPAWQLVRAMPRSPEPLSRQSAPRSIFLPIGSVAKRSFPRIGGVLLLSPESSRHPGTAKCVEQTLAATFRPFVTRNSSRALARCYSTTKCTAWVPERTMYTPAGK